MYDVTEPLLSVFLWQTFVFLFEYLAHVLCFTYLVLIISTSVPPGKTRLRSHL